MNADSLSWRDRVRHFFYEEEVPYTLALIRMMMPIVMLFMIVPRWFVAREVFSADGAPSQLSVGYGYGNLLPEFSGEVAVALNSLLVFACVTSVIGWRTRTSLWITFVLYTYFCCLDAISTATKYTVIASHVFLLLAVSPCGAVWSVDAWLAHYRRQNWPGLPAIDRPKFPVWPRRLLQLLLGIVYFGAAITKMQTAGFFSSDQLQAWMITHINYRHPVGEYFSLYPVILVAFAYIVVVWEVIFVFLVWERTFWRPFLIAIGVLFHFMTSLTLGLLIFPATMYTMYVSFVEVDDLQRFMASCRRLLRKFSWLKIAVPRPYAWTASWNPSRWRPVAAAGFAVTAVAFSLAGVAYEHYLDPYGERRPEGPYHLVAIDPDLVREMLAPTPPLRDIDKFFSLETGTIQFGDLLVDRRTSFRQGERMIAQCHLTMPHEDMWIEMHLLDGDNRLVARRNQIATREMYRAHFLYDFTESIEPGDYTLVIQTAGNEVLRKPLTLHPSRRSASAN
jgi:hypothetical protein